MTELNTDKTETVTGEFASLDGIDMYRIRSFDRMPPFLMSVVSDSDHWMYASTSGSLTVGRAEPERSLFPYETDDRLYRSGGSTGPFTLLRVHLDEEPILWEPFTGREQGAPIARNLYKSLLSNVVVFEETRGDLGLTFRYRWDTSHAYGFIRTATVIPTQPSRVVRIDILDGLRNIMPANVPLQLQQTSSTLVEAYRRNEVDPATGLAIYSLESQIHDRAEPAESSHANLAWSVGLPDSTVILSSDAIERFRAGATVGADHLTRGCRAHYLVNASVELGDEVMSWRIVADVHQTQAEAQQVRAQLLEGSDLDAAIDMDIARGSKRLRSLIASADGEQCTADQKTTAHHFANTLFNCMRGGVFVDGGSVRTDDLARFVEQRNRAVYRIHAEWLTSLGDSMTRRELISGAESRGDADLHRLCLEYLPLTFSRRHGDPSRPWNTFAINVQADDGTPVLDYQGNWRDIFQNWEALGYSFPSYLESMVAKFVNASTVDGFNPYRLTRNGIDWEVPNPDDPWSNIGYWGDHQIAYLLRLLEALHSFDPEALGRMLRREVFSYADVPYRIRAYDSVLLNRKDTIDFDHERAVEIAERTAIVGSDGKLLLGPDGSVVHVTLAEKLMVPALAKLGNLVVGGGIWMNTQRPEWNDANNALVGNGLSMVTLSYLRKYFAFCERTFASDAANEFLLSSEVATWLQQTLSTLDTYKDRLEQPEVSDRRRKRLLDRLGSIFSEYRSAVYAGGFSGKAIVRASDIVELCRLGREYADHTMRTNRDESGLYHSYNLIRLAAEGRELAIDRLPAMLEGQVAAISSGSLSSDQVTAIIDALYASPLYRSDQSSFMLYPAQELPGFLERNSLADSDVAANPLLSELLDAGDTSVIERDALGTCRFAPAVTTNASLVEALDRLSAQPAWTERVAAHRSAVEDVFEKVFHHKRFTGRSGSMYKYEGLGSVYWHMVAKLLLAVQEAFWMSRAAGEPVDTQTALADAYYRIRSGLSSDKTPEEYGAFPTDPYSHSPSHMGAQQPGMTGQVKEEILTRWGELGVRVEGGTVGFDPVLLRQREFLTEETDWSYRDVEGMSRTLTIPPQALAFTYCQVPIIYRTANDDEQVRVTAADGTTSSFSELRLDRQTSAKVFERTGEIERIEILLPDEAITR